MKLSWIVVNGPSEKVQEALKRLEIIADTYLSVNTPAQNALPAWLSLKEKIQQPIQERIRGNQKTLTALCASTPLKVLRAEGGWYGIIQLSGDIDEESWVMRLLETQHVFVHPGYFFDLEQSGYIIVSYLTPEKIFAEGLQRIIAQSRSL
jgi:aspartate/methionine/tyrosine aminotransferase